MSSDSAQSAQYLINAIKDAIREIQQDGQEHLALTQQPQPPPNPEKTTIELNWIAGHMGSQGNDAADELAKQAAESGSSRTYSLPALLRRPLPISLLATKQHIDKTTRIHTKSWWKRSKRFKRINRVDRSLPSGNYIKATSELNHRQTSILTQLRTGHIPLNEHLHRIGRNDTPYCQNCPRVPENVNHYLLHCTKYNIHRHGLVTALKRNAFNIRQLLSDPVAIRHTLTYVNATGQFSHIYGDITEELLDDNKRP